jgi:hypothetical protein
LAHLFKDESLDLMYALRLDRMFREGGQADGN